MNKHTAEPPLANDLIELTVQFQPHCVVEFSVKAQPILVRNAHRQAMKAVAKETTLPGFRKGKAPDEMILKNFGSSVDKKWQQKIAEESFREAEKLAKIPLLNTDARVGFTMVRYTLEEGAEMSFHFETEPKTPTIDYQALTLNKEPAVAIDPAKVDDTLHKICLFFAKWEPITERPVALGDFIIVDLDALEESGPVRVFSSARLEVNTTGMMPWMREMVLGMHGGETKEGISQPDETASAEDQAHFKPKKVQVLVKSIEQPLLPPVDDALANKVGAESAAIMKERLGILLQRQEEKQQRSRYRDQLSHLLLEKYLFDVPESLLSKEVQHRLHQIVKTPAFTRMSDDEKKQEVEKIKLQAGEALRLFYLCRKIALDNRLSVHPKDLQEEIHTPLEAMFADRELANPNKTEEQKNLLLSRILLEKAQDFVIDQILA